MSILGVAVVCTFLVLKGFWYIIFAFIFSVGVSYSQGVTAYRKYLMLKELAGKESPEDFDNEISPTRRRNKIIRFVFGEKIHWVSTLLSVIAALLIIDPTINRWIYSLAVFMTMFIVYVLFHFFILYWISYPVYKKIMKGGKRNGKQEK